MIHVVATVDCLPGKRDEFLAVFRALVSTVRNEPGCLEYGPALDVATSLLGKPPVRQDTVVVVEKWESLAALEAHLASPHMKEFFARITGMVKDVHAMVLEPA